MRGVRGNSSFSTAVNIRKAVQSDRGCFGHRHFFGERKHEKRALMLKKIGQRRPRIKAELIQPPTRRDPMSATRVPSPHLGWNAGCCASRVKKPRDVILIGGFFFCFQVAPVAKTSRLVSKSERARPSRALPISLPWHRDKTARNAANEK